MFKDITSVELFIAFFVPGFILIGVWEYFVPSQRSDWHSRIPQVVGYSSVYYAVALGPYVLQPAWRSPAYLYVVIFVLPVLVGLSFAKMRGVALRARRGAQATPWDQFFQRAASEKVFGNGLIVEIVPKDGHKSVIGYFGANSYASAFPDPPALYLQEVWTRSSNGDLKPLEPPQGTYIDCNDAATVRFTLPPASSTETERQ